MFSAHGETNSMIQELKAQGQVAWDYIREACMSTNVWCSYLVANDRVTVTSFLQREEDWHLISPPQRNVKAEPEEAYSADTTQQPIHIKASPNQAEHAVVCHWGIVFFLCNTQMIKEFNTASRLMTPLGCRGTQERRRQGLWRILAETGIGSKIYKFIHQKAVFLCHGSVRMWVCRWQRVNASENGGGGDVRASDTASLMVSASCEQ